MPGHGDGGDPFEAINQETRGRDIFSARGQDEVLYALGILAATNNAQATNQAERCGSPRPESLRREVFCG